MKLLLPLLVLLLTTGTVNAKELRIGLGNFQPYFIEQGNTGIFTDLIKEVFTHLPEYQLSFIYGMSNKRLPLALNTDSVDGAANIKLKTPINGCKTKPLFQFSDVAISLKEKNLEINKIEDLSGYKIIAFQGAINVFLSPAFKAIASEENYSETPRLASQALLLAYDRVDVSVGDIFIFLQSASTREHSSRPIDTNKFRYHMIFPRDRSSMGFNDPKLCDQFNQALQKVRANGRYEAIYNSYLTKFGVTDFKF